MLSLAMLAFAMPVAQAAEPAEEPAPVAEVLERDESGKATRIRVQGFEYAVCGEGQTDGCINPREAGLDFGGVPIDYWPGQPASRVEEPLPEAQPVTQPADD